MIPTPTPTPAPEGLFSIPSTPILMWVGPLLVAVIGMLNLFFQMVVFRRTVGLQKRTAEVQSRSATLNAAVAYMRDAFEVVVPGGSAHDVEVARDAQRALLRFLGRELNDLGVQLPVRRDWPNPNRPRFTLLVTFAPADREGLLRTLAGDFGAALTPPRPVGDGRQQTELSFLAVNEAEHTKAMLEASGDGHGFEIQRLYETPN